jgi:hypothetical protein
MIAFYYITPMGLICHICDSYHEEFLLDYWAPASERIKIYFHHVQKTDVIVRIKRVPQRLINPYSHPYVRIS